MDKTLEHWNAEKGLGTKLEGLEGKKCKYLPAEF